MLGYIFMNLFDNFMNLFDVVKTLELTGFSIVLTLVIFIFLFLIFYVLFKLVNRRRKKNRQGRAPFKDMNLMLKEKKLLEKTLLEKNEEIEKLKNELHKEVEIKFYMENRLSDMKTKNKELTGAIEELESQFNERIKEKMEEIKNLNHTVEELENRIKILETPHIPKKDANEDLWLRLKNAEDFGFNALMAKNYVMAIEYFKKAIEINPYNSNTLNYIAIAYTNIEKYDDAIEYSQQAIDVNCEDATAFYIMGLAYQKMGNQTKADEFFQLKDIIRQEKVSEKG